MLSTTDFQRIAYGFSFCAPSAEKGPAASTQSLFAGLKDLKNTIDSASKAGAWRRGRADLFAILERRNREELRSNVLAWLLDPDESHGCKDQLIRQVLRRVGAKEAESGRVDVARERWLSAHRRVDIFVTVGPVQIAIENKIDALEGKGQLNDYADALALTGILNENRFLLYITPDGKPCPRGHAMSWSELAEMVEKLEPARLTAPIVEHILCDFENILARHQ